MREGSSERIERVRAEGKVQRAAGVRRERSGIEHIERELQGEGSCRCGEWCVRLRRSRISRSAASHLSSFFFWLPQMDSPMIRPITAKIKKIRMVNFTYSEAQGGSGERKHAKAKKARSNQMQPAAQIDSF